MKNTVKYLQYIDMVLKNKGMDSEISSWANYQRELETIIYSSKPIAFSDSVKWGLDCEELILFVRVRDNEWDSEKLKNEMADYICNIDFSEQSYKSASILFVVANIKSKMILHQEFKPFVIKNIFQSALPAKQYRALFPKSGKFGVMFYLDKDISSEELKLSKVKRYEMVKIPPLELDINPVEEQPTNQDTHLKGYVFTADLFDIVEIYNSVGDQIFKNNVRLGIQDQLGVDKAICETLEKTPEAFWFRNNGITILIEEPGLLFDRTTEIVLKKTDSDILPFSIINGAQTITAAADFFYSPYKEKANEGDSKKTNQKGKDIEKAKKEAKVIVKIIHIQSKDSIKSKAEAKIISIALNRQKPIKAEDMAFTNEFVDLINEYLQENENYILIRRGEDYSFDEKRFSLIDFAKAAKACSGHPGEARSYATSKLLEENNGKFVDTDIFKKDWYRSDRNKEQIFKRSYSPILFAMTMLEKCKPIVAKASKTIGVKNNVLKNGMWYFIAYTVFALNDANDTNYENFHYSADEIALEDLSLLFAAFADYYCEILELNEQGTQSNTFKNSSNYELLKKVSFETYKESEFFELLCNMFGKQKEIDEQADSNEIEDGDPSAISG